MQILNTIQNDFYIRLLLYQDFCYFKGTEK